MRAEFIENLIPRRPRVLRDARPAASLLSMRAEGVAAFQAVFVRPVTPSPRPSPLRGEGVCACGEDPTRRRVAAPPSPFGEAMIRYLTDRKIHATVLSVD